MNLNELINTATFSCLLFLAILTLSKNSHTPIGYRFLSLLFILLAFNFADDVLSNNDGYTKHPALIVIFQPALYAFAPAIYLAVVYLTAVTKKITPNIILHFIPYLLLLSLYMVTYFFRTSDKHFVSNANSSNNGEPLEIVLTLFFFIQMIFYLYFSAKQLKKHRQSLPLFVSSISNNDYHWLYKTIIGLSILSMVSFMEVIFQQKELSFYFSFIYLIGFYYIGVQVAKQKDVFPFSKEQSESVAEIIAAEQNVISGEVTINNETTAIAAPNEPIENSIESNDALPDRKKVISEEKLNHYKARLLALMETEKPYLDSEITLPKLGKMLLLNTYQTSYLINASFGENFYTFINRYRLDECKKMLASNQYDHLSILGIAFEAGFNSKTAFNTSFKKSTGLSPKEFREQMDKEKPENIGSSLSTDL